MGAFSIELADGKHIPAIGWGNGTGGLSRSGQTAVDIGVAALHGGILHIDTAQGYGTEAETRQAVEKSGLSRDKVWVTTKLSPMENGKGSFQPGHRELDMKTTPESVKENVERAIGLLGGPPDLLLIHTPWVPEKGKIGEFWTILEGLVKDGTLKGTSLGVSNFRPADLRDVLDVATIKPVVHQLEYHPYVLAHLDPVQAIHEEHNIVVAAYGPLTPILRHPGGPLKPVLDRLAEKYKTEPTSILLRWTIQKNVVAITTSTNTSRLAGLAGVYDLELIPEEVAEIEEVGRKVYFRHYDEHMSTDYPAPDLPDGK